METSNSFAGVWQSSISLGEAPETTLADMMIEWLGEGDFTVEYSLDDGTTWKNPNLAPTESLDNSDVIDVRISFDGGIVDDPSYVSSPQHVVREGEPYVCVVA